MRPTVKFLTFVLITAVILLAPQSSTAQGSLPSGWSDGDIGTVGVTGSASYANDVFTVVGSGASVGGSSDNFHFAYKSLSGDGVILGRVTSVTGTTFATAGIMIRESLSDDSKNEFMFFQNNNGYQATYRTTTAGSSSSQGQYTSFTLPYWFKLVRSGNSFTAFMSAEGINWVPLGSPETISMATNVYVGLATVAYSSSSSATATFDNVSIDSPASPAPQITAVSATTGSIGSQVQLTGTNFGTTQGSSVVLLSGSPVTVNSGTWSDTSITITLPTGASTGPLAVSVASAMNDSNPIPFTVTPYPLPGGWLDGDVGVVGVAGSATYANDVFTVKGAGVGVNNTADSFHYVYRPLTGDGTIVARVTGTPTSPNGSVGVMIRDSLDAGAKFEYQYTITSSGTVSYYRTTTAGAVTQQSSTTMTSPFWFKVKRLGNSFTAYTSPDGENWVQSGTSQTISMGSNVYVGIVVANNSTSSLGTAIIDCVSVNSAAIVAPAISYLSATTGSVGDQFTITGSNFGTTQGSSLVLLNGLPLTINSGAWSNTSIGVTLPPGATSGPLVVSLAPSFNDSNPENFTVTANPLPTSWLDQDIGVVGVTGTASYSNGAFTIQGAGTAIGSVADSFHFAYKSVSGDVTLIARVLSASGTNTQAGVMIRDSLDASSANASVYFFKPSTIYSYNRLGYGLAPTNTGTLGGFALPYWLKIVRSGNGVTTYVSSEGVNWVQIGWAQNVSMGTTAYVGLAVSGESTSSLATVTFDNVSFGTSGVPAPVITNVSTTTGAVGSTVTINGSGFGTTQGNSLVYLNDSPVTIGSWGASSISITIPTGATSGPLVVSVEPSMNDSNAIPFTVTSQALPSPWLDQDIGVTGIAGGASYSGGVFTVQGAGNSTNSSGDGFHFVYQPLTTDGTIIARVASQGTFSQAGVIIRETLESNATEVFSLSFSFGSSVVAFMDYRTLVGGPVSQSSGSGGTLPYWVKVVRVANTFAAYESPDGSTWSQIGSTQTFSTAQKVYIGLGFSSGNLSTLGTGTFDNVTVTASSSLPNPVVTGYIPASGAPGKQIEIDGTGFGLTQGTSTILFNSAPATVVSWSDTAIVAVVPEQATTGPVSVVANNQITGQGPIFNVVFGAQVTDSLGNHTNYNSSMSGGQWSITDAQGSGCSTCTLRGNLNAQYDTNGNRVWSLDAAGNATTYRYNSNNNMTSQSANLDPSTAATTNYGYNSFGEVTTVQDALNHTTTNVYDSHGNLTDIYGPAGEHTQFSYNSLGELTTITDPLNNVTTLTYTSTGLIHTITDAQSNVTTYGYDAHGNRTSVIDALSHQTTFAYDSGDRLTTITYPDTTTTTFGYDYRGRRTTVTDQNGKTTTYAYDDADRLTSVTDAASNVTTYGYDTESNLTSITDANSHSTYFTYDAFGRVTQTNFPSTLTETYTYDANNNLATKTDRKGQTITYVYDALNRLTKKEYPDSTEVDYVYDLAGKIQQVNDPTGTYSLAYDSDGRLIGTTTAYSFLPSRNFTTSYGYDAASNRSSFTDPESGSTTYAYDSLNRLQTLTPPSAIVASGNFGFTYDALSRRTQMTRPNSVNTDYAYDNLSRLTSVLHKLSGSTIDGATYTVDNAGNRTAKTDQRTAMATSYGYDNIYQLLSATQGATTTESYTYDPAGNRTASLGVASYTTNSSNEMTANSNASYTYDYNGNETSKTDSTGTTDYTWDSENRLASVTLPGSGGTVSFKYDPFGRRIYKSSTSGTSVFAYDEDNIIEETNSTGAVIARYAHNLNVDEPLVSLRSGTASFYQADGLGSITSLSNSVGSLVQTYGYDSFGKQTGSSGSATNSFRYTAREFEPETDLYFYRARYYDPSTGRFQAEDPVSFFAGPNFYPYVQNDPLNWIDPSGMQQDSVTSSLLQAIRNGNAAEIQNILDAAGDVLSEDAKQLAKQAIQRLKTPCRDLVKGSLKRSASYHTELEEKTLEELLKDTSQAAKQMKKLIQQSPRLLDKRLPY